MKVHTHFKNIIDPTNNKTILLGFILILTLYPPHLSPVFPQFQTWVLWNMTQFIHYWNFFLVRNWYIWECSYNDRGSVFESCRFRSICIMLVCYLKEIWTWVAKEGSSKIVDFTTPGEGVLVQRCGHLSHIHPGIDL